MRYLNLNNGVYRGPNESRSGAVGDAVLIRRTIYSTRRDRQPGIFNGQRGIVTGIDPANRDMSIEWKDASGELLRRTLSAEYVAASVGSGYALTNHGAQGQSIRHVHADPAGVGRNAAYVQATRSVERVDLYTDLNSLGIVGSERIDVLRMAPTQWAQWAARQLADRINDLGWQHGETAHDATNTPIPMLEPPRVAAVPSEKDRPYWTWTTAERCRERLSGQYQLDRDKVEASPEGATRTELWTSTVPAKLVADTRTAAGEINARRQDVDNRHRDADVEIKRLQAVVEQAPQRGATAANTLADVGREQTIRASQPASRPKSSNWNGKRPQLCASGRPRRSGHARGCSRPRRRCGLARTRHRAWTRVTESSVEN